MVALNVSVEMVIERVVSTVLLSMSVLIVTLVMKMPLVPTIQVHTHASVILVMKAMAMLA